MRQKETLSNRCRPVKVFFYSFSNRPTVYSSASNGCTFRQQAPFLTDLRCAVKAFFKGLQTTSNKKASPIRRGLLEKIRRRPTFPHSYPCSIIGATGLNFCVRDGNRCDPCAIATENPITGFQLPKTVYDTCLPVKVFPLCCMKVGARRTSPLPLKTFYGQASRSISTG